MLSTLKITSVIIYGFGAIGKSVWMLCRDLNLPVIIADDRKMEYYRDGISICSLSEVDTTNQGAIIVCAARQDDIIKMRKNIELVFGKESESRIFIIDSEIYSPKYGQYLEKNNINFESNTFVGSLLTVANNAKQKYYLAKQNNITENLRLIKSRDLDVNIFRKMHQNAFGDSSSMILYPFFHVPIASESECKDFGFRNAIDWNLLNDRGYRKQYKIVCIFGNSVTYGAGINSDNVIPSLIEKNINSTSNGTKYKVINCAHIGDMVMDQISLYIGLFAAIKPDIVISINGIELVNAYRCDKTLVEDHSMFYKSYEEKIFSDYCVSYYPLPNDMGLLSEVDENKLIVNFFFRLKQFAKIVESDGGVFVSCLQPMLHAKRHKTKSEVEKTNADFESNMESKIIFSVVQKVDFLRKKLIKYVYSAKDGLKLFLDLNDFTSQSKQTIFSDWIHLTGIGNEIVSKNISKLIVEKC